MASLQLSDSDRKAIIISGDAALLVRRAEEIGKALADAKLNTTQIRGVFGTVRQIQADWPLTADDDTARYAYRQLQLLKPKMAYQAARNKQVEGLAHILTPAIDEVGGNRAYFQHFVDFFEAILAYHYAQDKENKDASHSRR